MSKLALVGGALICDVIGIILLFIAVGVLINTLLGILFALFSGVIFLLIGVPLFSGRRLKVWGSSMIVELFPFLNVLPALTFSMIWLIHQTNKEDKAIAADMIIWINF